MNREHLPLVIASKELTSPIETEPLDRIRMQKAVFLAEMKGSPAWKGLYGFAPYDWGPFSRLLARDLSDLVDRQSLAVRPSDRGQYRSYATTEAGERQALSAMGSLTEPEVSFLRAVRKFVTTRSLTEDRLTDPDSYQRPAADWSKPALVPANRRCLRCAKNWQARLNLVR
jgi:hypothetical protein